MTAENLVEIKDLIKYFPIHSRTASLFGKELVRAIDGVDLNIGYGETVGLLGESGCGKTTLGRCVLRLIESTSGRIFFDSREITSMGPRELRAMRRNMQIIFQDPFSSLDPRMKVGRLVAQPFDVFPVPNGEDKTERVRFLLEAVGLEAESAGRFPHEFSGGQRQRIAIARALALNPRFIVADEPVSALDVSIRSQILNLMRDLKKKFHLTYLYISHDLSTVKFICDRVAVMYLGCLSETGPVGQIFRAPLHPYTRTLIEAVPIPNPFQRKDRQAMKGEPPSPISPPVGCRFHPRCPHTRDICREIPPPAVEPDPGHLVYCHLYKAA